MSALCGRVPKVNALRNGVEEAAEATKLHVIAYGTTDLFIDDDGYVRCIRAESDGLRTKYQEHWRVGRYTRRSKTDDIEDDIVVRVREIRSLQAVAA